MEGSFDKIVEKKVEEQNGERIISNTDDNGPSAKLAQAMQGYLFALSMKQHQQVLLRDIISIHEQPLSQAGIEALHCYHLGKNNLTG
jgi:hypothetical protein